MMRIILVALIAMALMGSTRVVYNDPGGYVAEYIIKAKKTKSVRFSGTCASACTIYLSVKDTCHTPRARFLFHSATHLWATQYMLSLYPYWVSDWIKSKGGLTRSFIEMPRSYYSKYMRAC